MKKLFVLIVVFVATIAGASAMDLKEAFAALIKVPDVSLQADVKHSEAPVDMTEEGIYSAEIATAADLSRVRTAEAMDSVYSVLNQLPIEYMINGANNGTVGCFIYSVPDGDGKYEILMAVLSPCTGNMEFTFLRADERIRDAIRNATVRMQGTCLTIVYPENSESHIINIQSGCDN